MQDGNIHINIGNVSAKANDKRHRSVISAASYQSGEVLFSDKKNKNIDAREAGDGDVQMTEIIAPSGAPSWALTRTTLWNAVERSAKRSDARLGKKIEVALTRDIPDALRINLIRDYVRPFVDMGCVVDIAIHNDPIDHNPHAHILLTTFKLNEEGFEGKIIALDARRFVNDCRKSWADLTNIYLSRVGSSLRVDHRSYKARGIELQPTKHRGPHETETLKRAEHDVEPEQAHREALHEKKPLSEQMTGQSITPDQGQNNMNPTQKELLSYPNLIQLGTWPPVREAAQGMSPIEQDEHQRYWHEKDKLEVEILANDFDMEHDPGFPEADINEYSHAIEKAKAEAGWTKPEVEIEKKTITKQYEKDLTHDNEFSRAIAERSQALRNRAVNMHRGVMGYNREERELLELARGAHPREEQFIKDYIIHKRVEYLQDQEKERLKEDIKSWDNPERIAAIQEHVEWQSHKEREPDYRDEIVQGPNDEPLHINELKRAEEEERDR